MKRAPLVLTGTAAGLVAVISYHTAVPGATASTGSSSGTGSSSLSVGSTGTANSRQGSTSASKAARTTASTAGTTTSRTAAVVRSAVGNDIQYQYGDIELKVTVGGKRITDVSVVKEDITDPRSQQIDAYALPELRSEAMQAQSAKIDGVSGASYTSAAYEQSLQSAIDKLKA